MIKRQTPLAIETHIASEAEISALPPITFRGIKVLTTELVGKFFGCEDVRIRQSIKRNLSRFELEKHYFLVDGIELKSFKNQYINSTEYQNDTQSIVSKNAPSLMLWTERGVAKLAKIIDTDQAWDVIDKLVEFYFNAKKESHQPKQESKTSYNSYPQHSPMILPVHHALAVADFLIYHLRYSESSIVAMTTRICEEHNITTGFLPEYIEQQPVSSLSKLLEDFNLTHLGTAQKLNLILEEHGIIEKITRKSTKTEGKIKTFWSLTSKGLEWGKNEVYPPNPRETQPLYFRDKFMNLLKQLQIV